MTPDRSTLRPEIAKFLADADAADSTGLPGQDVVAARALAEEGCRLLWGEKADIARIDDIRVDGDVGPIPARVYGPAAPGPHPGVVFFHGGGWVIGSIDTHDGACRRLAQLTEAVIVSVEYRKAPEHRFPAAVDDAWAATRWTVEHATELGIDPARLSVVGESAGGNLAAVVARRARDHGVTLSCQVLVNPVTDTATDTRSYLDNAVGFHLTRDDMEWFIGHYLGSADLRSHPDVAPLRADDLSELAPAFVLTVVADPLHDEGVAYAERLAGAGVDVIHEDWADVIHGFFIMNGITPATDEAIRRVADYLDSRWAASDPTAISSSSLDSSSSATG